tara:strand:- start:706 stop:1815 length:1110 start_codon:yes stop_codon:yes gene_type:complete
MAKSSLIQKSFKNKNVLITGHTGFKGSWLTAWLKKLEANVTGVSLDPITNPSHFHAANIAKNINDLRIDIRDRTTLSKEIIKAKPDFVFHLAAQSLVRKSYKNPVETWETNVLGTLNVLEALKDLENDCVAIIITSDKCYDNVEWEWGYRETDLLGGPDPYSASKGAAELAIKSHIKSYFQSKTANVRIASARAGNVIGGGDWSKDRIIPDCVKAWSEDKTVSLRNPNATRPWQHVLEPLSGYISLAINLSQKQELHGEPFNFGPKADVNRSVLDLVEQMSINWNKVRWEDVSEKEDGPYESGLLKLNCDKALHFLDWHAVMNFEDTVNMTSEWYKAFYNSEDKIEEITNNQISDYILMAKKSGLAWAQ